MEGILIVNYDIKTYSRYWWDACTAPFGIQSNSVFSNHMGQALNSIHDNWWKPGILPLQWEVMDKQKEILQNSCNGGSGWRHHHKYLQLNMFKGKLEYMYIFPCIVS